MNRILSACRFLMGVFVVLFLNVMFANNVLAKTEVIEEVLITSPIHKTEAYTAHAVNSIDQSQLQSLHKDTLGEMLQGEAGINITSFGSAVSSPVIRGQSGGRVAVLQNNMLAQDASTISPDHAISIEPLLAEHIEVIRGPSTLLYGSGAIGGVVNVIDNRIPTQRVDGFSGAMEFRRNTTHNGETGVIKLEQGVNNIALHLDGVFSQQDDMHIPGYANRFIHDAEDLSHKSELDNSYYKRHNGAVGASWIGENAFIGASYSYQNNQYGISGHSHSHSDDDHDDHAMELFSPSHEGTYIKMVQRQLNIKGEVRDFGITEVLRFSFVHSNYNHLEIEDGIRGTRFTNKANQGRVEWVHKPWRNMHGAIGVQVSDRDFSAVGLEAFVPETEERSTGIFAIEEFHLDTVTLELGGRIDYKKIDSVIDSSRSFTTYSASISSLWEMSKNQTTAVILSHSQRAPEIEELYSNGVHISTQSYELGNDRLNKERSNNMEVNYSFTHAGWRIKSSLFYNKVSDYIFEGNNGLIFNTIDKKFETYCNDHDEDCLPVYQYEQQEAYFYGYEASVDYDLLKGVNNLTLSMFTDGVKGRLDSGNNIPRLPPRRIGFGVDYDYAGFNINASWIEAAAQKHTGKNETQTAGYSLLDAGIEYTLQTPQALSITLFLKGHNLLNEKIRHSTSFIKDIAPAAGRNISVGIRAQF